MADILDRDSVFGGRFKPARLLKSHLGVETWLADDVLEGQSVVVKAAALGQFTENVRQRVMHEAFVLRQIASPRVLPLLDIGSDAGHFYLVTPYVEGITLEERLRPGPLGVRDALTVGRHLLAALRDVHEHGVLHRDVKPANVIVDAGAPLARAVLIDFGFARNADLAVATASLPAGTLRYMSPEQTGTLERGVDARSDLYSTGVLLFECLAGRPPFEADSVRELLRLHLTATPPALRGLGVDVPAVLDDVIQRLLRKDPRDRYQSAAAVLADLDEIAAELERGVAEPRLVAGARDQRRTLTEPAFIGRHEELGVLNSALEQARDGRGSLVLLEAKSGAGKSWLLAELARRGAQHGAWILRGQGLDQSAQSPFQVLDGVVDGIAANAGAEPALGDAIRAALGDHAGAICANFPGLGPTLRVTPGPSLGPEEFAEARAVPALVTLAESLGTAERPVVVLLDDCQWADELTLRMVAHWQERRDRAVGVPVHMLLVVAFRSDEVSSDHALRRIAGATRLALAPFRASDIKELVESMAGAVPADALAAIVRLAEGSPFMAVAVLRGLIESGALLESRSGWRVDSQALASVQSSRRAAAFLTRRLELLPPAALTFLTAGAVLGKEFDLDFAAALSDQTIEAALAALTEARQRQLVWADSRGERCVFVHDKLREALLGRLAFEQRRSLHLRAGTLIERTEPGQTFDLAYHFDAAGQPERAVGYALVAAATARRRHSLEAAEQQYRIAERGTRSADEVTRREIAEGLGDVLMLRGRYEQAAEQLGVARQLCREPLAAARIEGKLGELAFKRGDMPTASAAIERGLRLLGARVPGGALAMLGWLLWEVVCQALHCLCPRIFLARRLVDGADLEFLAIRLYSRLAYAYWFQRGKVPCGWAHLREMNLAERYQPTRELAQAYSEHAPVMTMIPWFSRGIGYAEKSLAIRRQLGDLWGQGQSLHFYGVVLYAASRFEECIEKCREALSLLERTGDRWECNTAAWHIAFAMYRQGDLRGAIEASQRVYQAGHDIGDRQACGISLGAWAKASAGHVPDTLLRAELERVSDDVHTTGEILQAQALGFLADGHPAEAVAALEHAQRQVDLAGLQQEYVAPILPWLATAQRRAVAQVSVWAPARREAELGRLAATVRRAVRQSRKYRNNRPHALRELALFDALRGRPSRARRALGTSLDEARRQGARHEEAQTLAAWARLGRSLDWPESQEIDARAREALTALGADSEFYPGVSAEAQPTVFLADRFAALLETGRTIVTALSRDAVLAATRDAAAALLRPQHCLVLEATQLDDGETSLTPVAGAPAGEYSHTVVRRAFETRRPVVVTEGLTDDVSASMMLADVRSVLCAPFFAEGRPAGCLYLTHHQIGGLFGDEDARVAEFICSVAGAALENAEGHSHERRRAEARFRALIEHSSDIVTVLTTEGAIRYQSPSVTSVLGYDPSAMAGRRIFDYIDREDVPAVVKACMDGVAHPGATYTANFRFRHQDGSWRWLEAVGHATRDETGQLIGIVNSRDITDRRSLEERLRQSQRMEAVGQLAGGVAHDFNNILTIITGHSELVLRKAATNPSIRRSVDVIWQAAERGARLTHQLLAFSRKQILQTKTLDLNNVVKEIDRMLRRLIGEHIVLTSDLTPELGLVRADPGQLEQVIMNLVLNSRDAMPHGGRLTIKTHWVDVKPGAGGWPAELTPGEWIVLTVADTGVGMSPATLSKVFEPFFTTKEVGKGTGLGLATVYGIIKQSEGHIDVASAPDEGSTFRVFLPRVAEGTADAAEVKERFAARGSETVLLVEDERDVRTIGREILEERGYTVLEASDGADAVRVADAYDATIDVVVTDVVMPGMSGPEVVDVLRRSRPRAKVLFISGYTEDHIVKIEAIDRAALLRKPFRASTFARTVREVLDRPAPEAR